jgi:predicted ester cyclase
MNKKTIARAFSNGEFEKAYDYISENAVWKVVEENTFHGKKAIIENCEQVLSYFNSVTTRFEMLNIISEGKKVAVNGIAEFIRDGKRVSFVSAVDIYEFEGQSIQKITSYCIPKK